MCEIRRKKIYNQYIYKCKISKIKYNNYNNEINNKQYINQNKINKRNKITPWILEKQANTVKIIHTHNPNTNVLKTI